MKIWDRFVQFSHQATAAILLGVFFFPAFVPGGASLGGANSALDQEGTAVGGKAISNGQFVYGPNVASFRLAEYLEANSPALERYADDLYGRAEYYSINPKILLTLLEMYSQLVTDPVEKKISNPFGFRDENLLSQVDRISGAMVNAYYLHLNDYSSRPMPQRTLPAFTTRAGELLSVRPETNAGTYALIAGLAIVTDAKGASLALDKVDPHGFYQTYRRLFPDDPTSEENHILTGAELSASGVPASLLQLPYPRGQSWVFNGVHNQAGGKSGSTFTDASSIDFSPGWPKWDTDTGNMWVVAAAAGIPRRISACFFEITHADGWQTSYYHLENIQVFSATIHQNDRIGVLANTFDEATCSGGSSTGPHLHFALKKNGAFVAINGTPLSGWSIHSGRWQYDTDPNYMWLERAGIRKNVGSPLLSEAPPNPCGDCATFAEDVTVPPGTILAPGDIFTKTWRLKNTGSNTWGEGYSLAFVAGDLLGASASVAAPSTAPDTLGDLAVSMTAPVAGGSYAGFWQMRNPHGKLFGDIISVKIGVSDSTAGIWHAEFNSQPAKDGWILEGTESSSRGATMDSTATTLIVGDDAVNRQYRSILSFNTMSLPDDAAITMVQLRIRRQSVSGANPLVTHGGLKMDIKNGYFGAASGLATHDFEASASLGPAAAVRYASPPGWHTATPTPAGFVYVNLTGPTQIKLRFRYGDDDDLIADTVKFFSANAIEAYQPQLIIEYTMPGD
jgi:LasA protease